MKKQRLIAVIIAIIIIVFMGCALFLNKGVDDVEDNLKIYFFDAGKADAILISKDDKYIMIDTGEASLSSTILDYFKKNNITKLNYLIITHFDKDHVGSASSIIDNIEIGEVLQSNYPKDSEFYNNYINSLNNKNITPITVGEEFYNIKYDDLHIDIVGPSVIYDKNESNNSSLIVSITYKDNNFLFMGDAENQRITDFVKDNTITYDFMKIPYHGRYLKRLDDLLDNVKPRYGVMTCSDEEGCEDKAIRLLDQYKVKYYMTKNGDITVISDGYTIDINQ